VTVQAPYMSFTKHYSEILKRTFI